MDTTYLPLNVTVPTGQVMILTGSGTYARYYPTSQRVDSISASVANAQIGPFTEETVWRLTPSAVGIGYDINIPLGSLATELTAAQVDAVQALVSADGNLIQTPRRGIDARWPTVVMANPPTIGTKTTVTGIASPFSYTWNNPAAVRLSCGAWTQVGANPRARPFTSTYSAGTQFAQSGRIEFATSSPTIEIQALYDTYLIFVDEYDGLGWKLAGTSNSGNSGVMYFVPIDWTAAAVPRKPRKYRIDCGGSTQFANIVVPIVDKSVSATVFTTTRRGGIIGDSFVAGSGATTSAGFANQLGWLLGYDDWWVSGQAGAGLLQVNGINNSVTNRLTADVIDRSWEVCLIQCSQNDLNYTPYSTGVMVDALTSIVGRLRAAGVTPATLGVWNTGQTSAGAAALAAALESCATSLGVVNVPNYDWINGTGRVGSTNGTGNADFFVSSDGTHPSQAGHDFRAQRTFEALAVAAPAA